MYQIENQGDFVFVCRDNVRLYFSRFLMMRNRVFAAMINTGMAESTRSEAQVAYSAKTMEVVLQYLDAVPRPDLGDEDISEIAAAAHFYDIQDLLKYCSMLMVQKPRSVYVKVAEMIVPQIRSQLLSALVNTGRLAGLSREIYSELFAHFVATKVAWAFSADGHAYGEDLTILLDMDKYEQQVTVLCAAFPGTNIGERLAKHIAHIADIFVTKTKSKVPEGRVIVLGKM